MVFCVFHRIIIDLKYRIPFYTAHSLEVQNCGTVGRRLHFKININLLKPTGYVMQKTVKYSTTLTSAHIVFICYVLISERGGAYRLLVGKPEGKRPLRMTRRNWMDNVMMDLQQVYVGMWTELAWTRIGTCGGLL